MWSQVALIQAEVTVRAGGASGELRRAGRGGRESARGRGSRRISRTTAACAAASVPERGERMTGICGQLEALEEELPALIDGERILPPAPIGGLDCVEVPSGCETRRVIHEALFYCDMEFRRLRLRRAPHPYPSPQRGEGKTRNTPLPFGERGGVRGSRKR